MFTRFYQQILLLAGSSLLALSAMAEAPNKEQAPLPLQSLRDFADVFNQIRSAYVEEVTDETLLENAIRGMLTGLDPHSDYLDESAYGDLQTHTSGEFGGIGIEVGMENGFVKVIAPIDDTPAQRAGLKSGDLIIQIDNTPLKGMSLQQAVGMMRGAKGSKITITVLRDSGTPFELTLERDVVSVASVRENIILPGYGYLRIAQFQSRTGTDLRKALKKLKAYPEPLRGIVLDLRNNPGGLLQASVQVVDEFINEGLIVYTEGRLANSYSRFEASSERPADTTPLVVLINGGSASASEIVAGALQDHRRAIILGTRSFGKGSVQTVLPLSDSSAIKLTTARYFTPSGRSIQALGIEPDIIVERAKVETLKSRSNITEADLAGHLDNGGKESGSKDRENTTDESAEIAANDNQLYEALNLLKGMYIMSQAGQASTPKN